MAQIVRLLSKYSGIQIDIDSRSVVPALSIFVMWLFTISALIGIAIGYETWFIPQTPLNLSIVFLLALVNFNRDRKFFMAMSLSALIGFFVEVIGVKSGAIFGNYYYGDNLGFKVLEVPLLIGVFWFILALSTSQIARYFFTNIVAVIICGSLLMIGLDYFMEQLAHRFDFWHFEGGLAGFQNYIGWYATALVLQYIIYKLVPKQSFDFSLHLWCNQLVFFTLLIIILSM